MAACKCRSHSGAKKQLFRTENHAQDIARKRGWIATVYPCRYKKNRYHLTHYTPKEANDYDRS